MAYFIREGEPSYKVSGPFTSLVGARKKALGARFTDITNIYQGTDPLCAYDEKKMIGQVAWTYSGQRWLYVYYDAKTKKTSVLNKDGTIGRRY